ncbi:hypothetical protein PCASD_02847 [Puccinia coronata f. sp. avenae]|uniref:Uncharacterized protein n=1 Tax=Puccinia coronata f. sp. avenae TaxID=200324 RepID=A0A2N5VFX7_9BASI|nr:hypothetical protein PCASD_02847 [Puccinia coronata f. sp. avenae]
MAERANWTIIKMVRCMLLNSKMAPEWWAEAVMMAAATTNVLPSLSKSKASPVTLFLKQKPRLEFFKPFGCKVWALKPKAKRDDKFEVICWEGTLLGYTNDYTSYRIIKHCEKSITYSRKVQFDEQNFPVCPAQRKSYSVRPTTAGDELPVFHPDPILPFEEALSVEDPREDNAGEEEIVDAFPALPDGGRRWVYVCDHQPADPVSSAIDAENIITGKSLRKQVCFVSSTMYPKSHALAMKSPDCDAWKAAEKKELNNMAKHEGFRQTFGINFDQKYAPTGKAASLRLLLLFALNSGLEIHRLDVRSAFLTCPLEDKVTLYPPHGFQCPSGTVLELRKAIYGLKQASSVWYKNLRVFLESIGFKQTESDPCVFVRLASEGKPATWIFAHVNDLVVISKDPLIFKKEMESEFDIKYLGTAEFLLGMNINQSDAMIHIHQTQYIERKLQEFGLKEAPIASCPLNPKEHLKAATSHEMDEFQKLVINYRALIGSLNYLSVLTRPDVSYAGTKQVGLVFKKEESLALSAHVDADWGNCPDTRRSVIGYIVLTNSQTISWKATRQATLSLLSTEAEYKALSDLGREIAWLANLLSEIKLNYTPNEIPVGIDNQGAIDLARSKISQNGFRTKHMDIRLHFVRELVTSKLIKLRYIKTTLNSADFLTKPTGRCGIRRSLAAIGRKRVTTQDDARMERQELLTKGAKLRKTEMPHEQRSSLAERITNNYY